MGLLPQSELEFLLEQISYSWGEKEMSTKKHQLFSPEQKMPIVRRRRPGEGAT